MLIPQSHFASSLKSPLEGVPLSAWRRFTAALEVQGIDQVSERGGFGSYDLRPRRLEELGLVTDLRRQAPRRRGQPQIYICRFLLPWTRERLLSNPLAQLEVLAQSMKRYLEAIREGRISSPGGLSLAGALAILHCGGEGALAQVAEQGTAAFFPHTRAVYERAKGAF